MLERHVAEQVAIDLGWPKLSAEYLTEEWLQDFLATAGSDPVKLASWEILLEDLRINNPVGYKQLIATLKVKSSMLELQGYERWLRTLGPNTFTGSFAWFHQDLWKWYWPLAQTQRRGGEANLEDLTYFAPWGRGNGKCLAAGTEILKADGTRVPIDRVRPGDRLLSVDQATGRSVTDTARRIWVSGKKRCLRLRTRTGKRITVTPEHRLWSFDGWMEAGVLRVGDRVAVPRRTRPRSVADRSDAEVKLVAYMIAGGCTTSRGEKSPLSSHAGFTNADSVIVDDFKSCALSLGMNVTRRGSYGYYLKGAQDWIKTVGLSGKSAHHKRIPEWVFQLPERQRWLFLAAMIDTDGYVTRQDGIGITLANEMLIQDLTYLFVSVGVISSIYYKPNNCSGAWVLQVDGEGMKECILHLPLILKLSKLAREKSEYSLLDTYPYTVGKSLPPGVHRKIRNAGGPKMGSRSHPRVTRGKVRRALALYPLARWAWLEQADVFWDEITSIEDAGIHETYDIQMSSPSENFIANGIVSHNSSHAEWLAIAEGCLVGTGFVLYVCSGADQAEAHVEAIRDRLESEKAIRECYPGMGKPSMKEHKQYGWRQDYLMTGNGWAIRPVGLDKAIRGWKRGDTRVSMIIFDDVDDDGDGPDVIANKEKRITRKILPMGTARTKVVWAQNPIHSNSILNRMLTRQTNILAVRRGGVVVKSFRELDIEFKQTPQGPRHVIKHAVGEWPDLDIKEAQSFLDRSDLPAFMAEYQHDFSHEQEERVLPEYDDRILRLHVITWSQFVKMYFEGVENPPRRIPNYWPSYLGGDFGYTPTHLTAFTWLTRAPANAPLTGSIFRYRGKTFSTTSPDDIAMGVRDAMWPARLPEYEGERAQLIVQSCSHEKAGERLLFNNKFGFYLMSCEKGKEVGVPQWRHFLRPDRSQPHPFHRDELQPDGTWKLGRPAWFDIVDDDQFIAPRDDKGMKGHRDGAYGWKYKKIKITESGMTVEQPMKVADDENDSTRQLLTRMGPPVLPLTPEEKVEKAIPKGYHWTDLQKKVAAGTMQAEAAQMTYESAQRRAQRFIGQKTVTLTDEWGNALLDD